MQLKIGDVIGAGYLAGISLLLLIFSEQVGAFSAAHSNIAGFCKFALLASYGECLKSRISGGSWKIAHLPLRAFVWGCFGIWISWAFVLIDNGVNGVIGAGLWGGTARPLSLSVWMNIISGYPFAMMFVHYWIDKTIEDGFVWPWHLFGMESTVRWAKIVFISLIVFWVPAHTFTFSLDPHLRVICAAYLSIALGLILSFAARARVSETENKLSTFQ
ncbi:hypothetical protein CSW98_07430 [Vibrio sp. HA2012]|uniref:hypothetical protein n=1 Tax=Vibrio sp. HA2012 TaxID=1971595 RepID=UPI000C2B78BE|nr:hypothetical protein [Vibrio sp. HA2012]PJC86817.1 hypothetical protein CSW98_07430 [Vibrio sp. HA2012]